MEVIMRRFDLDSILVAAKSFMDQFNFKLPPFAYCPHSSCPHNHYIHPFLLLNYSKIIRFDNYCNLLNEE